MFKIFVYCFILWTFYVSYFRSTCLSIIQLFIYFVDKRLQLEKSAETASIIVIFETNEMESKNLQISFGNGKSQDDRNSVVNNFINNSLNNNPTIWDMIMGNGANKGQRINISNEEKNKIKSSLENKKIDKNGTV